MGMWRRVCGGGRRHGRHVRLRKHCRMPLPLNLWEQWRSGNSPTKSPSGEPSSSLHGQGTLFHIIGRKVEIRTFGEPAGGGYGTKSCAGRFSRMHHPGQGNRAAGEGDVLHERGTSGGIHPAGRLPDPCQGGNEERRRSRQCRARGIVDTGYYSFMTQAQVAVGSGELRSWPSAPTGT